MVWAPYYPDYKSRMAAITQAVYDWLDLWERWPNMQLTLE